MLTGLGSEELRRLPHESPDQFTRFRSATLAAIREQVDQAGTIDPAISSRRIRRDFIEPDLSEMKIHIASSRKSLAKEVASQVIVSGVLTATGVLTSSSLLIGSGIIGARLTSLAPSNPVGSYWNRMRQVEMNDLYFLLKADRRTLHHIW